MFRRCKLTGLLFLIDSGSESSLIRNQDGKPNAPSETRLKCANGSRMKTLGKRWMKVDIGAGETTHGFECIPNLKHNIIGMDYLKKHVIALNTLSGKITPKMQRKRTIAPRPQDISRVDARARKILQRYPAITDHATIAKEPTHNHRFFVELNDYTPITQKGREPPQSMRAEVKRLLLDYLDLGIVERAPANAWAMPLVYINKSKPGEKLKLRLCLDTRRINSRTKNFSYKTASIWDVQANARGATIFSKLDLYSAYHCLPADEKTANIMTAQTPIGKLRWMKATMGAKTAGAHFNRLMDDCLSGMDSNTISYYLDDIVITSGSAEEHERHLEEVCRRLNNFNLILNVDKCEFFKEAVTYLGFKIDKHGISPTEEYKQNIAEFLRPITNTQLRSFIGQASYIRATVPDMAKEAAQLTRLLTPGAKTRKILWDEESVKAFESLKQKIKQASSIAFVRPEAELQLISDASRTHYGACLYQAYEGKIEAIGFASKVLGEPERNWSAIDREMGAIKFGCKHFRIYIEGRQNLVIYSDNQTLVHLLNGASATDITPKQVRYITYIMGFAPTVRHIQGKLNPADLLTRQRAMPPPIGQDNAKAGPDPRTTQMRNKTVNMTIGAPPPVDYEKLAEDQQTDETIRDMENGLLKTSINITKEILPGGQEIKGEHSDRFGFRILVPRAQVQRVIAQLHEPCHVGIRKTKSLVAGNYVWPGMATDVTNYVRGCENCARAKVHKRIRTPQINDYKIPKDKLSTVHLDHAHVRDDRGYKYVLIAAFHNTSYFVAVPQKTLTASETVRAYIEGVVSYLGAAAVLVCDNASYFRSTEFTTAMEALGTQIRFISPYFSNSNGKAENRNKYYKTLITALGAQRNWRDKLPMLCLYLRNSVNEGNAYTPAEEIFGRNLRLPQALVTESGTPVTQEETAALIQQVKAQEEERWAAGNPTTKKSTYTPKEMERAKMVMIEKPIREKKMENKYTGPFLVLENKPHHVTVMRDGRAIRIPWNRAKIFHPRQNCELDPVTQEYIPHEGKGDVGLIKENTKQTRGSWVESEQNEDTQQQQDIPGPSRPKATRDRAREKPEAETPIRRTSERRRRPVSRYGIDENYN